jgi:hypothetical protein
LAVLIAPAAIAVAAAAPDLVALALIGAALIRIAAGPAALPLLVVLLVFLLT